MKNTNHLNKNHLSDEDIAFCAQQMMAGRYPENIPENLSGHLAHCPDCEKEVREFYHLISDEPAVREAIAAAGASGSDISKRSFARARIASGLSSGAWWKIGAAAAAILIIALAVVLLYQGRQLAPEKLFAQYYEPYGDVITTKSSQFDRALLDALFHYNNAEYDLAVSLLLDALPSDPENEHIQFYLAGSYLAKGSYPEAIQYFTILAHPASRYYSPAQWYLALAYLGSNETIEAKKVFEKIEDAGGFYASKAAEILRRLK